MLLILSIDSLLRGVSNFVNGYLSEALVKGITNFINGVFVKRVSKFVNEYICLAKIAKKPDNTTVKKSKKEGSKTWNKIKWAIIK